jgi:hypothetical protein
MPLDAVRRAAKTTSLFGTDFEADDLFRHLEAAWQSLRMKLVLCETAEAPLDALIADGNVLEVGGHAYTLAIAWLPNSLIEPDAGWHADDASRPVERWRDAAQTEIDRLDPGLPTEARGHAAGKLASLCEALHRWIESASPGGPSA